MMVQDASIIFVKLGDQRRNFEHFVKQDLLSKCELLVIAM